MSTASRGFASMPRERQRAIASQGGRAAHQRGTAHQWTSAEAAAAGRKGGQISRGGRGRLPVQLELELGTPTDPQPEIRGDFSGGEDTGWHSAR